MVLLEWYSFIYTQQANSLSFEGHGIFLLLEYINCARRQFLETFEVIQFFSNVLYGAQPGAW